VRHSKQEKYIEILKAILCEESATISVVVLAQCRSAAVFGDYFWLPNGGGDGYGDTRCSVKAERHVQLVYKLEAPLASKYWAILYVYTEGGLGK